MSTFKKCKVVMLPTNKKANEKMYPTIIAKEGNKLYNYSSPNYSYDKAMFQDLYITSNDEIKEGDWYMDDTSTVRQSFAFDKDYWSVRTDYKKIIASTDSSLLVERQYESIHLGKGQITYLNLPRLSDSFIQKYVKEYNKGNIITDVLVEYKNRCCGRCDGVLDLCVSDIVCSDHNEQGCNICFEESGNILKVFKDNTITIKKVKDSWSREEHIHNLLKYKSDLLVKLMECKEQDKPLQKEFTDKWIEENL